MVYLYWWRKHTTRDARDCQNARINHLLHITKNYCLREFVCYRGYIFWNPLRLIARNITLIHATHLKHDTKFISYLERVLETGGIYYS